MSTAREEQYELEQQVYASRSAAEPIRIWLRRQRDSLNAKWTGVTGEDLTRMQGEAKQVALLLRLLEDGPRIKTPPERAP